jgi:hypothetical protein
MQEVLHMRWPAARATHVGRVAGERANRVKIAKCCVGKGLIRDESRKPV